MDALPIPKPQVLDPHRRLVNDEDNFTANHEARAVLLQRALETSCSYADQLWNDLNAMRQYLLDCLPPDPHTATGPVATGAAPSGPDDEHGWQNWMTAFAEVTSVLCGPHGDSGFGPSRAREEAQRRRASPAAAAPRDGNAELDPSPDAPKPARPATPGAATPNGRQTEDPTVSGRCAAESDPRAPAPGSNGRHGRADRFGATRIAAPLPPFARSDSRWRAAAQCALTRGDYTTWLVAGVAGLAVLLSQSMLR